MISEDVDLGYPQGLGSEKKGILDGFKDKLKGNKVYHKGACIEAEACGRLRIAVVDDFQIDVETEVTEISWTIT